MVLPGCHSFGMGGMTRGLGGGCSVEGLMGLGFEVEFEGREKEILMLFQDGAFF